MKNKVYSGIRQAYLHCCTTHREKLLYKKEAFGIFKQCIIISSICLFVASGCKQNQYPIDTNPTPIDTTHTPTHIIDLGKASLKKDGLLWKSEDKPFTFGSSPDRKRFSFHVKNVYSYYEYDSFHIGDIPCAKGVYPILDIHSGSISLFTPDASYSVVINYDEPSGDYTTDVTRKPDNFIEILNYNPADSTIEGRFQVFLALDSTLSKPQKPEPNFINITEGKFYVKLH
jgi:hypothetical protein